LRNFRIEVSDPWTSVEKKNLIAVIFA